MSEPEFLTLQQAARLLGISRQTMYRRTQEGAITVYESPANRRVRLVRRADVEALLTPQIAAPVAFRPLAVNEEGR